MYRIAIYYEGAALGRNDGNPLYMTAYLTRVQYYCDVINKRAVNDLTLRYFPIPKQPKDDSAEAVAKWFCDKYDPEGLQCKHLRPYGDLKPYGDFDLHVWVDWGEDGLTGVLGYTPMKCPRPMVYWASDTHLGYDYRLGMAKQADYVFCAQKKAVDDFIKDGINSPIWLPHAVEPLAYPRMNFINKKYDVCFIGHVNSENRMEAIDRLFREFPNFIYGQKRFEEAAKAYGESKVVFNIAMKDDLNMRCFEIMGTKSLLMTDRISTIEELFKDGEHLVLYNNLDDLIEKTRYYIDHEEEREKIAEAGYNETIKNHTFKSRVTKMLETVMEKKLVAV